jgi:hypothetical protein
MVGVLMSVGVMTVGVMTVGVMSVGEITVGVMTVGVMRRPRYYDRDLTLGMNRVQYRTNYVRNTHNPYCTLISLCILNLEGNQMTFDLQIRQVPDQTFPLSNRTGEVTQ